MRLPVEGPLPARMVLVPGEAVAHALRRELLRAGHPHALAGTRFIPATAAAAEVLHAAAVTFTPGEEALRPPRLTVLFRSGLPLGHFPLQLLREKPGWDEAFARTIGDLEAAGLRPEDLEHAAVRPDGSTPATPRARLRDVGAIWRAVDESAGRSWTTGRIHREAALALERQPDLWWFPGAVLACAGGHTSGAEARFLRAIPGATLALLAVRPVREHHVHRVKALFGATSAQALVRATVPRPAITPGASASERDILAAYLFEPPVILADPARPRSAGPDGTVDLEEHAGVEAEIEATADWVARQVLDGTALEEIAVLVPSLDPLAGLVAERLARLPWPESALRPDAGSRERRARDARDTLPVHVAGGLLLTLTTGGARALAVVRALRAHLAGEALADVLPALRTVAPEDAPRHLSHGSAMDLAWSLGTAGGNPAEPGRALEWAERAARREQDLARQLDLAREAGDDPERAGLARQARDLERLLADLRAVRPALDALVGVARLVVEDRPLAEIWPALRDFLDEWLLQPGEGPRVHTLLDERLDPLAGEHATGALTGDDALRVIEGATEATRLASGRFGEPAVYVGTVRSAVGLPFSAVRVIGLAEGHLPPPAREDPVVPDNVRATLRSAVTPLTAADAALAALHALDAVVRNAEKRVALSAPRLDVERSQREASSVVLEAAAALGRPNAVTGEHGATIPDLTALRRDAFAPARRAALAFRREEPIAETAWQDAVAHGGLAIPSTWRGLPALDLDRIAALRVAPEPGALDGLLEFTGLAVPGLAGEWPISPSALETLLRCPHQFLLQRVLHLEEPPAAPPRREIGQPAYGALVHRVAEVFFRAHGAAFCAREAALPDWRGRADLIVEREFDAFLEQYPLVGEAVRNHERERLRRDVQELVEHDWRRGACRFVAVEHAFGGETPVELALGDRSLFVRGRVDRLEVEGGATLVRDLKTGRAHPRLGKEAGPDPSLDVQIAVYGLVAAYLAAEWGVPRRVAAAYAYVNRGIDERAWPDFQNTLAPVAREWLRTAADLLAARAFPRTPDADDCRYCHLRPVCGEDIHELAREVLVRGGATLASFRALKGVEGAAPASTGETARPATAPRPKGRRR